VAGDILHLEPLTFSTTSTALFRSWCLAIFCRCGTSNCVVLRVRSPIWH